MMPTCQNTKKFQIKPTTWSLWLIMETRFPFFFKMLLMLDRLLAITLSVIRSRPIPTSSLFKVSSNKCNSHLELQLTQIQDLKPSLVIRISMLLDSVNFHNLRTVLQLISPDASLMPFHRALPPISFIWLSRLSTQMSSKILKSALMVQLEFSKLEKVKQITTKFLTIRNCGSLSSWSSAKMVDIISVILVLFTLQE